MLFYFLIKGLTFEQVILRGCYNVCIWKIGALELVSP